MEGTGTGTYKHEFSEVNSHSELLAVPIMCFIASPCDLPSIVTFSQDSYIKLFHLFIANSPALHVP